MKIEDGKIKPCSACLKARQYAKDNFNRLIGKEPSFTLVQLTNGDITLNERHIVTAVSKTEWTDYLGKRVYLAGKSVYDVEEAAPIIELGLVVKTSRTIMRARS